MPSKNKNPKFVKFVDNRLFLRINSCETELGFIFTRKGGLTRAQKLKAVAANGEWIEI